MRMYAWRPDPGPDGRVVTNFGDELNHLLWPRLLGDALLDPCDGVLFLGIGSLLGWPKAGDETARVVIGTGAMLPDASVREPMTDRWRVHAVRGPLTAATYGLDPSLAIADPGILVAGSHDRAGASSTVGFMPHLDQAVRWSAGMRALCDDLGIRYIDPRDPVEDVLAAIAGVDRLVTEAMHGAIVADALRVPWVPVFSGARPHRFKWTDWCASMDLEYEPVWVPDVAGWAARHGVDVEPVRRWSTTVFAARLKSVVRRARPALSRATVLENRLIRLHEAVDALQSAANA